MMGYLERFFLLKLMAIFSSNNFCNLFVFFFKKLLIRI